MGIEPSTAYARQPGPVQKTHCISKETFDLILVNLMMIYEYLKLDTIPNKKKYKDHFSLPVVDC